MNEGARLSIAHFATLLSFIGSAYATPREWRCYPVGEQTVPAVRLTEHDPTAPEAQALFEATLRRNATVKASDIEYPADQYAEGLNLRWNFGWQYGLFDPSVAPYSFLIEPSGEGLYYDFTRSDRTSPSDRYNCRRR